MPMEKIHQYLQSAAVLLGILVPCILLAGYVYHLGYSVTFGLDPSLINKGFSDVITEAWLLGTLLLVQFVNYWWTGFVVVGAVSLIMLGLFYFIVYLKAEGKDPAAWEITKEKQGRKIFGLTLWHWKCWFETVQELGTWVYIPTVLLLLATLVAIIPFQQGANEAKKQIGQIQKSGCNAPLDQKDRVRCVSLVDISITPNATIFSGILVSSNNDFVALFDGQTLEVFRLKDDFKLSKPHHKLNPSPKP